MRVISSKYVNNRVFFFNDTATTEIYTLSLHDALPIWTRSSPSCPRSRCRSPSSTPRCRRRRASTSSPRPTTATAARSEEHTSELQSRQYLVCRLLLEKKKILPFDPLIVILQDHVQSFS